MDGWPNWDLGFGLKINCMGSAVGDPDKHPHRWRLNRKVLLNYSKFLANRCGIYRFGINFLPVANFLPLFVWITVKSMSNPAILVDPLRLSEDKTNNGWIPFLSGFPAFVHLRSHFKFVSPFALLAFSAVASTAFLFGLAGILWKCCRRIPVLLVTCLVWKPRLKPSIQICAIYWFNKALSAIRVVCHDMSTYRLLVSILLMPWMLVWWCHYFCCFRVFPFVVIWISHYSEFPRITRNVMDIYRCWL